MERALRVPHCRLVRAQPLRAAGADRSDFETALRVALEAARKIARFYEPLVHLEHAEFARGLGDGKCAAPIRRTPVRRQRRSPNVELPRLAGLVTRRPLFDPSGCSQA